MTAQGQSVAINRTGSAASTRRYWFMGNEFAVLADQSDTAGRYDLIGGRPRPGYQTPFHRHTRYSEQLYVLDGEMTIRLETGSVTLHPGESFLIPIGTVHAVEATGDTVAHGLVVASPSSFAHLIEEVGTPFVGDMPPEVSPEALERFKQIAEEIGDEILGPAGAPPVE